MAIDRARRFGDLVLLTPLGTVGGERRWYRGVRPPRTPVHVVVVDEGDPLAGLMMRALQGRPAPPGLPAGALVTRGGGGLAFSFAYKPSVLLADGIAQAAEMGEIPLEVAATIAISVAHAVDWVRARTREHVPFPSLTEVLVDFDGGATSLVGIGARLDDDYDNLIGVVPMQHDFTGRRSHLGAQNFTPEGFRGEAETAATDAFAAAALFFQMLEDRHPFERENFLESARAAHQHELAGLQRRLPDALGPVFDRAFAREPALRFHSASAFADALRRVIPSNEAAVSGWLCGLFPETLRAEREALDALSLFDHTTLGSDDDTQPELRAPFAPKTGWCLIPAEDGAPMFEIQETPVRNVEFARFLDETGRDDPPGWFGRDPHFSNEPTVFVEQGLAAEYAGWIGGRLPSEDEWRRAAYGGSEPGVSLAGVRLLGRVWEWTTERHLGGHIVRGGPWRNRVEPARVDNRSWEDAGTSDVGFRCVRAV